MKVSVRILTLLAVTAGAVFASEVVFQVTNEMVTPDGRLVIDTRTANAPPGSYVEAHVVDPFTGMSMGVFHVVPVDPMTGFARSEFPFVPPAWELRLYGPGGVLLGKKEDGLEETTL